MASLLVVGLSYSPHRSDNARSGLRVLQHSCCLASIHRVRIDAREHACSWKHSEVHRSVIDHEKVLAGKPLMGAGVWLEGALSALSMKRTSRVRGEGG